MGTVFISYRRGDSSGHTGRLFDSLEDRFGREPFFRDLESLEYGIDFPAELDKALASCRVVLVMIGPGWINAQANGARRLDKPDDLVRLEVAAALARSDVRTIPVRVGGATMPSADELPEPLKPLATRNSIEISDERWDYDLGRLADALVKAAGLPDLHSAAKPTGSTQPASDVAVTTSKRASGLGKVGVITLGSAVIAIALYAIGSSEEEGNVSEGSEPSAAVQGETLPTFEHEGLTWTTDTEGMDYDWNEAVAHCKEGGEGWRLPTLAELRTIVDPNDPDPLKMKVLRPFHQAMGSNYIWSSDADGTAAAARMAFDFIKLEPVSLAINEKEGMQVLCVSE